MFPKRHHVERLESFQRLKEFQPEIMLHKKSSDFEESMVI